MVSQLITKLRTKEDLETLRNELSLLEKARFQTGDKYNQILKSSVRGWVSEMVIKETEGGVVEDYLCELEEQLEKVRIVSASMNFEPSDSFIDTMSIWFKKNVGENVVFDILLNGQLLGGIQLSYNGKYLDLSLRKKILAEMEKMSLNQ